MTYTCAYMHVCICVYIYIYMYLSLSLYIYIYMHVYTHLSLSLYIYIYIYICVYVYVYVCVYICIYIYICVHTCIYMHMCMHTCMRACVHVCIYAYMHTCIHAQVPSRNNCSDEAHYANTNGDRWGAHAHARKTSFRRASRCCRRRFTQASGLPVSSHDLSICRVSSRGSQIPEPLIIMFTPKCPLKVQIFQGLRQFFQI